MKTTTIYANGVFTIDVTADGYEVTTANGTTAHTSPLQFPDEVLHNEQFVADSLDVLTMSKEDLWRTFGDAWGDMIDLAEKVALANTDDVWDDYDESHPGKPVFEGVTVQGRDFGTRYTGIRGAYWWDCEDGTWWMEV